MTHAVKAPVLRQALDRLCEPQAQVTASTAHHTYCLEGRGMEEGDWQGLATDNHIDPRAAEHPGHVDLTLAIYLSLGEYNHLGGEFTRKMCP